MRLWVLYGQFSVVPFLCLHRSAFFPGSPCQCFIILEIPSAYFPAFAANPGVEIFPMSFCSCFSTERTGLFMALRVSVPSSSCFGCHSRDYYTKQIIGDERG